MTSNTYPKDELELTEKLIKLHGPASSSPFSDLTPQLKSEFLITTSFLKSFLREGSINSVIFSPAVISSSLAMLSKTGAGKETKEEMENVFGKDFDYDENDLKNSIIFRTLIYSNKLSFSQSFKKCWSKTGSLLLAVDLLNNVDKVIEEINLNVSEKTEGKISKLVDASSFIPEITLCLGIAATFESQWNFTFPFDTPKPATFYSNPPRQIDMIRQKEKQMYKYSEGEDWTCMNIGFGYYIPRILFVLLPKERDGLAKLIEKFDYSIILQCIKGIEVNAIATIPTFKIESSTVLDDKLKDIGINKLFDKDAFDQILTNDDTPCGLDLAVHAARIKINQFGADGYDDTADHLQFEDLRIQPGGYGADPGCREVEFVADHPFIFFVALWTDDVQENKLGLQSIQFAGIYS